MTEKQWYRYLVEDKVTMMETEQGRQMIPCRVEVKNPDHDWETAWSRASLPSLSSVLD